eukprot:TRINITY_DN5086_c0_g1_i5.p1 TRINITY_DN5086_c0_g1~~TRINITY_DN5086_c0_g1_i5.p1  ORF type:complete len:199 (+),score=24.00 TRINITY_DN5086_c0_g1_i5:1196-1792(+)
MTTKDKKKMVHSKKPKNQECYTVCPYINPLNKKPCENNILKSGLSHHLWRSHGIRVKSREGKILKHKTTHNTQINMDTDGSDSQDEIDICNEEIGCKEIGNEDNTERERKKEKLAEPMPNMENFSKWLKEEERYSRKGVKVSIQTLHHLFKVTERENLHEYLEEIRIKQSKATFKRKEWTAIHYDEYWEEKEEEKYWK